MGVPLPSRFWPKVEHGRFGDGHLDVPRLVVLGVDVTPLMNGSMMALTYSVSSLATRARVAVGAELGLRRQLGERGHARGGCGHGHRHVCTCA